MQETIHERRKECSIYHTRAIISRGLNIFYPIFHCGLYSKAAYITTVYVLKSGNSSKISAVYNQEQLILQTIHVLNKEM